jgi:site-specific DNA-cytosine methylase
MKPIAIQDTTTREKAQNGRGWSEDGTSYTLDAAATQGVAIAFQQNTRNEVRIMNGDGQIAGALQAEAGMKQQNYLATGCMTPELPQRVRVHGTGGTSPTLSSEQGRGHGVPTVLAPTDSFNIAPGKGALKNDIHVTPAVTTKTLDASGSNPAMHQGGAAVVQAMAVRRLTPRECERLQGFPDDHTLIPWRGKSPQDCPDGPRYKALGNSMAVPCMAWIGKRIAAQHGGQVRYLSVCSGIEAASVAWEPLGWEPAAFAEVEKFPSAVLAHHWPQVPNMGDMTRHESWNLGAINLLVGGTPCQSFSVAGLRKGLHDPRGGLMLTFLEIAQRQRPRWIVWENVPGVLSSHGGRDFGAFLGALGALGYGWAYRVLDAQWFGVAQRRRRVFVVGCLGDGAAAATVLFESESVCRNPAPSREARERTAAFAPSSIGDYRQGHGTLRATGGDTGGQRAADC